MYEHVKTTTINFIIKIVMIFYHLNNNYVYFMLYIYIYDLHRVHTYK